MITQTELILNILSTVAAKASYLKNYEILEELNTIRNFIYRSDYVHDEILSKMLSLNKLMSIYE